jgi:hypothetical protein
LEDKVFIKETQIVRISNGQHEIVLPRMTLKKIMAVTDGMDKLVQSAKEKSPQVFEIFNKTDDNLSLGLEIVKVLPSILPLLMSEIINILSVYLEKDKDWIENNFDMEDLVAVATPFFEDILKQGSHLTDALTRMFPKKEDDKITPSNTSSES